MRKYIEVLDTKSCLNRANENEMVFVLLGRDVAAPAAIRAWIRERILCGKNNAGDSQILEAEECARLMETERLDK